MPAVTVEIRADDAFVDIVAEGFDAGLRLGESLEKDMIAVRVGPLQRMVALAAPAFLARRPAPSRPRDLVDYPCIATQFPSGMLFRCGFEKAAEPFEVAVRGPLIFNDRLALDAVVAGLGRFRAGGHGVGSHRARRRGAPAGGSVPAGPRLLHHILRVAVRCVRRCGPSSMCSPPANPCDAGLLRAPSLIQHLCERRHPHLMDHLG